MMHTIFVQHRKKILIAFFALAAFLIISEATISVLYREMYVDEMFSPFRSYTILKGELIPFVNGAFYYPPLVIPTHGLIQYLWGPSFLAGRLLSASFFLALTALTAVLGYRLTKSAWAALAVIFLIGSNLLLVSNYTTGTMYALAGFLLMVMVWAECSALSSRNKILAAALLSALLILLRTNMVVVPLLYLIYLIATRAHLSKIALFVLGAILIVLFGYAPIVVHNPEIAIGHIVSPFFSYGLYKELPASGIVGGHTLFRFLEVFTAFLKEYYGFMLVYAVVLTVSLKTYGRKFRAFVETDPQYFFLVLMSAGLLVAHYFYWRAVGSVYYANYFMPVVIIAIVVGISRYMPRDYTVRALLVGMILINFASNLYRLDLFSDPRSESDLKRVERGAAVVERAIPAGAKILAFDNSLVHIFEADRRTYQPLVNRDFLFWANTDTDTVKRLGFYNLEMLQDWLTNDAEYLVLHDERWSLSFIRLPFWGEGDEDVTERLRRIRALIDEKYVLIDTALNVYPRKYTEGNDGGTLKIYKRKP